MSFSNKKDIWNFKRFSSIGVTEVKWEAREYQLTHTTFMKGSHLCTNHVEAFELIAYFFSRVPAFYFIRNQASALVLEVS